jgi:hypothetical protein
VAPAEKHTFFAVASKANLKRRVTVVILTSSELSLWILNIMKEHTFVVKEPHKQLKLFSMVMKYEPKNRSSDRNSSLSLVNPCLLSWFEAAPILIWCAINYPFFFLAFYCAFFSFFLTFFPSLSFFPLLISPLPPPLGGLTVCQVY